MNDLRYPIAARFLHWVMAALILTMIGIGLAMIDGLAIWRLAGLRLHQLGGVTVLILAALRLAFRSTYKAPPLPNNVPSFQAKMAHASHFLLYALMFAVPLAGWLMQSAAGIPITLPGGFILPSLLNENLSAYGVLRICHGLLAWSLLGLILLHIAGALHHAMVRRDGLLKRMI